MANETIKESPQSPTTTIRGSCSVAPQIKLALFSSPHRFLLHCNSRGQKRLTTELLTEQRSKNGIADFVFCPGDRNTRTDSHEPMWWLNYSVSRWAMSIS